MMADVDHDSRPLSLRIQDVLRPEPPSRKELPIFWKIVLPAIVWGILAVGLCFFIYLAFLALGGMVSGLAALRANPDQDAAHYVAEVLSVFAVSTHFFAFVSSGVIPPRTDQRRRQLYFPLKYSQITRSWIRERAVLSSVFWCIGCIAVLFALNSGASPVFLLMQSLWLICILFWTSVLGYYCASHAGQLGKIPGAAYWSLALWTFLSLPAATAVEFYGYASPIYWFICLPRKLMDGPGIVLGGTVIGICFLATVFLGRQQFQPKELFRCMFMHRPGRRQLFAICRRWRDLPDKEQISVGKLDYPLQKLDQQPAQSASAPQTDDQKNAALAMLIRENMVLNPSRFQTKREFWILRIGAIIIVATLAWASAATAALLWSMGDKRMGAIFPLIVALGPMAFSVARGTTFVPYGLVNVTSLISCVWRAIFVDLAIASSICLPAALGLSYLRQDLSALARLAWWILGTLCVAFIWPFLTRIQFERENWLVVFCFLALAWIPLVALASFVAWAASFFMPPASDGVLGGVIMVCHFLIASIIAIAGWDRVAMVARPRVEKLVTRIRRYWPF